MVTLITAIITGLVTGLTGFLAAFNNWFFKRRPQRADAVSKEIDNEIKLAEYYKTILDDLSARYENKFKEIEGLYDSKVGVLKSEIALLNNEITILNKRISDLKKENLALRKRIKELER